MKRLGMLLAVALLAVAGCGENGEGPAADTQPGAGAPTQPDTVRDAAAETDAEDAASRDSGVATRVVVGRSEFGDMLFGPNRQAIYIFENDPQGASRCYGECAAAWPPVFTEREPRAGTGVRASLLGTAERRDGRLQVTYAGKPLYYYAHEGPGEVRCHDVDLNGGLWWVVGPDGKRRP
ncbi:MAG TPA: hypothetical protein VNT54_16020 [Solirubrobacteraceae bacterium]|nr:hypothetical protein [Solirubrobacteraceae bacterium]